MLWLCPYLYVLKVSFPSLISAQGQEEGQGMQEEEICFKKKKQVVLWHPGKDCDHSLLPPVSLRGLWTSHGVGYLACFPLSPIS